MPTKSRHDTGGAVVAAALIGFGCLVIWDTLSYVDSDSAVFPRTFASVMILACLGYIVMWLLGRGEARPAHETGSTPRRVLLVGIMLTGALAIPWIGFLPATLPVFYALILVAMYDPWTRFRTVVYPIVGTAIVLGFYFLFAQALMVPLPVASIF